MKEIEEGMISARSIKNELSEDDGSSVEESQPGVPPSPSPTKSSDNGIRRTPTTESPRTMSMCSNYETPMEFVEVKIEEPESVEWEGATCTPLSISTKQASSTSSSDLPYVTPPSSPVSRDPKISEIRQRSENLTDRPENNSCWIEASDDWVRKSESSRIYPVTERVERNGDVVPLMRPILKLGDRSTRPKKTDEVPAPACRSFAKSINEDEIRPGPSGLNKKKRTIYYDSDVITISSDEENEAPNINKKKEDAANRDEELTVMSLVSDSDDDDVAPESARNNAKNEGNVRKTLRVDNSENYRDKTKKIDSSKLEKKRKSLEYARVWRSRLESDRTVKGEKTNLPFTKSEKKAMVDYLCSHEDILAIYPKGLKIWYKMLEKNLLPHRTAQSLNNHFTKTLLPHIEDHFDDMSEDHKRQFKALQTERQK